MRILILTNLYPTEGAPTNGLFIHHRVAALTDLGHDVNAFALNLRVPRFASRFAAGDHSAPLRPFRPANLPARLTSKLANRQPYLSNRYLDASARKILTKLEASEPDVIVAHGMYQPPAGAVASRLARILRLPYVVVLHGSDVNLLMPSERGLYASVLNDASHVIFVSSALRTAAMSMGTTTQYTSVIPNGIREGRFGNDSPTESKSPIVAYVGNLANVKGADRLPLIFGAIHAARPNTEFHVIGDGPLRRILESQTAGLPIRFFGRVPQTDVAPLIGQASVLVAPSRSEGWPNIVLESHASATPIVATDVGGLPEAIDHDPHIIPSGPSLAERFAAVTVDVLDGRRPLPPSSVDRAKAHTWTALARCEVAILNQVADRHETS